jgi:acyl-CoA thioester hydrolase
MACMAPYRTLVPMRWSDMDVYRHINNVQVVRLLEEARVQAFTAWDDPKDQPVLDRGVLVARTEVEYLRQLDFRVEPIAIDLWVSKLSGATIELGYEVREPDEDSPPYARAETTLVMFDLQAGRPRRLSPVELQRLRQWSGDPVQMRWRRSVSAMSERT